MSYTAGLDSAAIGSQLIGVSRTHRSTLDQLARIAASEAPTLIEGETGSGKEVAAREIHYGGPRRHGPFVPVNCGALPDTLIESELFGVERGAFTDARRSRRGLAAEAEGGTLFLDEVDALSAKAQVTLLRFLQDQRYRPVGSSRELCADVRLIAATNQPLDRIVGPQGFRADLMYRLKILHLALPPLREREGDAELLAEHFIALFAAKYRRRRLALDAATRSWMRSYPWPGNVRELENWVHREFLMCAGEAIVHEARPAPFGGPVPGSASAGVCACFAQAKAEAVRRFEQDYLARVLDAADGNVTRAARLAGKERRAFGKLLKRHGIVAQSKAAEG